MTKLRNSQQCPYCGEYHVPGGAATQHENSCKNGGPKRRRRTQYREVFLAHNGPGPYECYFNCGVPVLFSELIVHHKDIDHTNNEPSNLTAAHRLCHNSYHFKLVWSKQHEVLAKHNREMVHKPHTQATKDFIRKTKKERGDQPTDAARELAREKNLGGHLSPETRRKIGESNKRNPKFQEKMEKLQQRHVGSKRSEETKKRMSEAAKNRRARDKAHQEVMPNEHHTI